MRQFIAGAKTAYRRVNQRFFAAEKPVLAQAKKRVPPPDQYGLFAGG
jgi:hypothetical protein